MTTCCPPNSIPYVAPPADYKDQGEWVVIDSKLNTYTVGPQDAKSALIVIADAYGVNAGRHHQLCDAFAENGWRVYMPDVFCGEVTTLPDGGGLDRAKLATFTWKDKVGAVIEDILIPYIQKSGALKIAACGFCFGYYVVSHLNVTGKVVATGGAHPSLYNREPNAGQVVAEFKCPVICLSAGNDRVEEKPGGEEQNILLSSKSFGSDCVFKEFPNMVHGWVCRGDASNDQTAAAVKEAFEDLQSFFQKFL